MTSIFVNGDTLELTDGQTVKDLVRQLKIEQRALAVEVNKILIPRAEHATKNLANGDNVEIVTLVGGG